MTPNPKELANLYTQQHDEYIKYVSDSFTWKHVERPAFDNHISALITPKTKILDAGCGNGRTINYCLENGATPQNIIGVDINHDMLKTASQSLKDVILVQTDIENLPVADNSQDLIICNHVLHYLDNQKYQSAMNEFHRVLQPGGMVFTVITHPIRTARGNFERYFERRWIEDTTSWGTPAPFYFRPVSDLVNLAISSGLKLEYLDELQVNPAGIEDSPADFTRYTTLPPRLALKLKKQTPHNQ